MFCELCARTSKTVAVVASILLTSIDILLLYGAIWFEHFGSDSKRTLVNRLFTSLCWTGIATILVAFTDVFRYTLGPFPPLLCKIQLFLKKIVKDEIGMFCNAITLCRYVFIFWLRNPTAVHEDFWNYFANLWITIACTINAVVYEFQPNRQALYYYSCCGLDPNHFEKLPEKTDGTLLIPSAVFQIVLNARIIAWKNSNKMKFLTSFFSPQCSSSTELLLNMEKETIMNCYAICCTLIFFLLYFGQNLKLKYLPLEEINDYPNYLYMYFRLMIAFQIFGFIMLSTYYAKNKKMCKVLYAALKEQSQN